MVTRTSKLSCLSFGVVFATIATLLLGGWPQAWAAETNTQPVLSVAVPVVAPASAPPVSFTGEQALQKLMDGNGRFMAGQSIHPDQTNERRLAVASGQAPFAVVFTCSDSRVAPELFFDLAMPGTCWMTM